MIRTLNHAFGHVQMKYEVRLKTILPPEDNLPVQIGLMGRKILASQVN
jgi:hypothetical protein